MTTTTAIAITCHLCHIFKLSLFTFLEKGGEPKVLRKCGVDQFRNIGGKRKLLEWNLFTFLPQLLVGRGGQCQQVELREEGGAARYLGGGTCGIFKTKMGDNLLKSESFFRWRNKLSIFVTVLDKICVAKDLNMRNKFELFNSKI